MGWHKKRRCELCEEFAVDDGYSKGRCDIPENLSRLYRYYSSLCEGHFIELNIYARKKVPDLISSDISNQLEEIIYEQWISKKILEMSVRVTAKKPRFFCTDRSTKLKKHPRHFHSVRCINYADKWYNENGVKGHFCNAHIKHHNEIKSNPVTYNGNIEFKGWLDFIHCKHNLSEYIENKEKIKNDDVHLVLACEKQWVDRLIDSAGLPNGKKVSMKELGKWANQNKDKIRKDFYF